MVQRTRREPRSGATLEDWLTPDHIGWSVRHARELVPTEPIRASPTPRPLPVRPDGALLEAVVEAHDGPVALVPFLEQRQRDALVVVKDGAVVLEWYADDVAPDEPHLVFSITKSVTGTLACALATAGLLDLAAPVVDVVPQVGGSAFADATVRQLMDMEASFAFVEDYTPGPDLVAYRHAAGWYPAPGGAPGLRGYLAAREPDGAHGERFRYLSPTFDLLGWVCAEAADSTWAAAVERYLWGPCGAESDANVTLDRDGTPRAAGGMSATARDVARFGHLLLDRRTDVLSPVLVDDVLHGGHRPQWARGDFADLWEHGSYRSGWYAPNDDPDLLFGIGIHGQMLCVDLPRGVVVVVLSSWSAPDDDDEHRDNEVLCRTLARALA